ncbi:MAG TPA: HypC/HybG/HupF family hydrogenase formation chaperone [Pseudonocardiaceae bacterium]
MSEAVTGVLAQALADDVAAAAVTVARRLTADAALWCLGPADLPHAQRLIGADPVSVARGCVRAGDLIVAVDGTDDPAVRSVLRRAPAWGATTIWIGHGTRPPAGSADHVLWIGDGAGTDPAAIYYQLWEQAQRWLDQPGQLPPEPAACTAEVCVTCSDEGRLGEVIAPDPSGDGRALVRTATGQELIDALLVHPVEAGDLVLVHAGSAITKLPCEEEN